MPSRDGSSTSFQELTLSRNESVGTNPMWANPSFLITEN